MTSIPSTVQVAGNTFELGAGLLKVPVPGHAGWVWSMERQGHFITHGWHKDGRLVHADIFNGSVSPFYAILTHAGQEEPYRLDAQSGFGWTDDEWLDAQAVVESTPWDAKFDTWNDVLVTKDTGSSNMSLYSPPEVLAKKYGVSAAVLRFYDRYRRHQARRPRWWINAFGLPVGMHQPELDLPNFGEWDENVQGMNAYDLQHFDGYELYTGYMLTRDPAYLLSMINLWTHAVSNGWYLRQVPDQLYGGSIRTPAWHIIAGCQLYEMLLVTGEFSSLASAVKQSVVWHLDNIIKKFPISSPWYHGSPPNIFRQERKNYIQGWQYAVVSLACQRVKKLFQDTDPELAAKAESHGYQVMVYITSHCDEGPQPDGSGWIARVWAPDEDPAFLFKISPPGISDWYLAPLMQYDVDEFPVKQALIDAIIERGWHRQSHKYFTYAVNVMGDGVWDIAV